MKIIPRATLISVVALGIGYVITSLAFVSAFPESQLIKVARRRRTTRRSSSPCSSSATCS